MKSTAYGRNLITKQHHHRLQIQKISGDMHYFSTDSAPFDSQINSKFSSSSTLTLYQYYICPFCNKTKALLDYLSLPYKAVEVNPLTKAELKPWSGTYRKVPIAIMNDTQHNGSNEIISALLEDEEVISILQKKWEINQSELDTPAMSMKLFRNDESVIRWSEFGDSKLASILYPNICRTLRSSYDAFSYVHDVKEFSFLQKLSVQTIGSFAMYFAASKIKKRLNIQDERQALNDALDEFEEEGLDSGGKTFISGLSKPNLADISLYGTLHSIEHLSSFREVMDARNSDTTKMWYGKMKTELSTQNL